MTLVAQLSAVFLDHLHIEVPGPDTDLIESGLLDSLQLVELLVQIEQRFGLQIMLEDLDFDDLRSVTRIAGMIATSAPRQAV